MFVLNVIVVVEDFKANQPFLVAVKILSNIQHKYSQTCLKRPKTRVLYSFGDIS